MKKLAEVPINMANILDGKKVADGIAQDLKSVVESLKSLPVLQVLVIGDNSESSIYVNNKMKRAQEIGIKVEINQLPSDVLESDVISLIKKYNNQQDVTGIMVQLPLPKHISYYRIINEIDPAKDMDGFSEQNVGRLWAGNSDYIAPATPVGIMALLDYYQLDVSGKNSVIIGRSNIVGKPLAALLLARNSTVSITHSKTQNLKEITKNADYVFVAVGKAEMIDSTYIKQGAVVVDVGINRTTNGLKGDVNFSSVQNKASFISPVPRGVGPMTVISLMKQIVDSAKLRENDGHK